MGCRRWQVRRDENGHRLSLWPAPPGTCAECGPAGATGEEGGVLEKAGADFGSGTLSAVETLLALISQILFVPQ